MNGTVISPRITSTKIGKKNNRRSKIHRLTWPSFLADRRAWRGCISGKVTIYSAKMELLTMYKDQQAKAINIAVNIIGPQAPPVIVLDTVKAKKAAPKLAGS